MNFDDTSNTRLQLGLGLSLYDQSAKDYMKKKVEINPSICNNKLAYLSLTLGLLEEDEANNNQPAASKSTESYDHYLESSSFSNSSSFKRETDHVIGGEEFEVEIEKVPTKMGDVDEDGNPRKKLRLTKEQSAVLEENFKEHSTLNPKQKQVLAKTLNLRARQVEVWFQNRRARTKLKQTESDCQVLKKYCETLTEENKKLLKELHELKSMQTVPAAPFYVQIYPAAATLTICPSCERICGGNGSTLPSTTLLIGSKPHPHLYKNNYIHSPTHHPHSTPC